MVVKIRGKTNKRRGSKTHGWGSPKKHRGSGSKGGVGNAGRGKKGQQKMTLMNNIGYRIGAHGFVRPPSAASFERAINIDDIEKNIPRYLEEKAAKKSGDAFEVNALALGYTKVLGRGNITSKLIVTAKKFSKSAIEKLKAAGGEAKALDG